MLSCQRKLASRIGLKADAFQSLDSGFRRNDGLIRGSLTLWVFRVWIFGLRFGCRPLSRTEHRRAARIRPAWNYHAGRAREARVGRRTGSPVGQPPCRPRSGGHPTLTRKARQGGVRRWGKMVLVTFAETKVTRARGDTRILFSNHRGSDTKRTAGVAHPATLTSGKPTPPNAA
jgi:hypothetical protein